MSIVVDYNALSSLGAYFGLEDYLEYYEITFSQEYHYETGGFSSVNSSNAVVNGTNYGSTFADLQYASETSATGQTSAFIAGAAPGEQLVYTLFNSPTHTLMGPLDTLTFGADLGLSGGAWGLAANYLTISGLDSVLNGGLDANGAPIPWQTGNNDVHNVLNPLLSGSAQGVRDVFDEFGITINGTAGNDEFDGYAAADIFVSNGGADRITNFSSIDQLDITGLGFADVNDALASYYLDGVGNTVLTDGVNEITLVGYTSSLSVANFV
jgi:hypothetical protein